MPLNTIGSAAGFCRLSLDGVVVYFPQERILYGNCLIKQELGNLSYADLKAYPNSLRHIQRMGLDYDLIIAGHQDSLHGPELIDHYLHLLEHAH